jgi:predicted ATPase
LQHGSIGSKLDAELFVILGEGLRGTRPKTTKEGLWEAEGHRIAGEIAPLSPEPSGQSARLFGACARGCASAAHQVRNYAPPWASRLWHDQGKLRQARELLAPVYCWFTELFDTRDLQEAKALLEELAA